MQTASVEGPLHRDIVRRVVRRYLGQVRSCVPDVTEPIIIPLTFEIRGNGRLASVEVPEGERAGTREQRDCVRRAALRWRFPTADGPTAVRLIYAFTPPQEH